MTDENLKRLALDLSRVIHAEAAHERSCVVALRECKHHEDYVARREARAARLTASAELARSLVQSFSTEGGK